MATLASLTAQVRRLLEAPEPNRRPDFDTLSGNYTVASGTINMTLANTLWKRGDTIEFTDDGLQLVCTADGTGGSVAVAVRDGTDANHSSGELVNRNPLFSTLLIQDKINEVVNDHLWPHVWSWHKDTLTFATGTHTYVLDAQIVDVIRMYQHDLNSDTRIHVIPSTWYQTETEINSAVVTNGNALNIARVWDETATVYYEAKRKPASSDLTNLDARLEPLIVAGAAALISEGTLASEQEDRSRRISRSDGKAASDARVHSARFFTLREQVKATLRDEIPVDHRFRRRHQLARASRGW